MPGQMAKSQVEQRRALGPTKVKQARMSAADLDELRGEGDDGPLGMGRGVAKKGLRAEAESPGHSVSGNARANGEVTG